MNILFYFYLAFFLCIFPLSACLLFNRYKPYFHGVRILIPILFYSFLSWSVTNGVIFLKYWLDPTSFQGPEGVFALFFGWLYLWITSIPVILIYLTFLMISNMVKKEPKC